MLKVAFVLEQTLGHVSHSRNIERALTRATHIEPTVIRLEYPPKPWARGLSPLQNWSLRASLATRNALLDRLRAGRIDALFIHTQVASLLSTSIMRSVPTVISLDATPLNIDELGAAYRHSSGGRLAELLKRRINRRALRSARGLVTWCEWASESLRRDYSVDAGRVSVIHPGVDLDLFQPDPGRRPGVRPRLLFVGGDFERKGGRVLMEAWRSLQGLAELDIVSPSAAVLDGDGVRVHRGLPAQSPGLIDLYRQADAFVLPTLGDCFPQAIAEALATGLPVVATDVGGIREMVTTGVNGYLVRPGSARELAASLQRLVGDPSLRARMGRASLARARADHDAARNNRRIFDLLERIAATPSRLRPDGWAAVPDTTGVPMGSPTTPK